MKTIDIDKFIETLIYFEEDFKKDANKDSNSALASSMLNGAVLAIRAIRASVKTAIVTTNDNI